MSNGVDKLCGWFLKGEGYSLPNAFQTAFDAGFRRGASVEMIPLPEMLAEPSFSTIGFQARIQNAPAEGSGVVAHFTFHTPVCQVQVFGYEDQVRQYLDSLADHGWKRVGALSRSSDNVMAERWYGGSLDNRRTLVVNRWAGPQPAPNGLWAVINVLAGEDPERGVLK